MPSATAALTALRTSGRLRVMTQDAVAALGQDGGLLGHGAGIYPRHAERASAQRIASGPRKSSERGASRASAWGALSVRSVGRCASVTTAWAAASANSSNACRFRFCRVSQAWW